METGKGPVRTNYRAKVVFEVYQDQFDGKLIKEFNSKQVLSREYLLGQPGKSKLPMIKLEEPASSLRNELDEYFQEIGERRIAKI